MSRKLLALMTTTACVLIFCSSALAHHGSDLFDMTKPVTLKGVITKFEWGNPHNQIYLDVTDNKGNVAHWVVSTEPPAAMLEKGWTRKSLNPGDHVTAQVFVAANGAPTGNLHQIKFDDGGGVLESYAVHPPPAPKHR